MIDMSNIEDKFPIDKNRLDEEWLRHHAIYRHYLGLLREANDEVDNCKKHLNRMSAKLDGIVRGNLSQIHTKVTEAMVNAGIIQQRDYCLSEEKLKEANQKMQDLKDDVAALDIRKSALENLVRLYGQEYFSVPYATEKEKEQFKSARVNTTIRRKLNPQKGE